MSAGSALQAARAAGVSVALDGDQLLLKAAVPPPAIVVEALSRHKAEIVILLRPTRDGWSAKDWHTFLDERTAIAELVRGLPRAEAEAHALAACIIEWLNRNPECSPPSRCHGCGQAERALENDPLLPFGNESTGHAWLHSHCSRAWHARREADARAALAAIGIRISILRLPIRYLRKNSRRPEITTLV
jgi:hypothetical protein